VNFVRLPQGATVSRLSVYGNDNDGDIDIHAYLIRKLIVDGTTPKETGYTVMASASSSGAVNGVIREFDDTTINRPIVDNTRFMYYAELVVCGAVEPFMVQVAYS
jgi:predicted glycosyltransferase